MFTSKSNFECKDLISIEHEFEILNAICTDFCLTTTTSFINIIKKCEKVKNI